MQHINKISFIDFLTKNFLKLFNKKIKTNRYVINISPIDNEKDFLINFDTINQKMISSILNKDWTQYKTLLEEGAQPRYQEGLSAILLLYEKQYEFVDDILEIVKPHHSEIMAHTLNSDAFLEYEMYFKHHNIIIDNEVMLKILSKSIHLKNENTFTYFLKKADVSIFKEVIQIIIKELNYDFLKIFWSILKNNLDYQEDEKKLFMKQAFCNHLAYFLLRLSFSVKLDNNVEKELDFYKNLIYIELHWIDFIKEEYEQYKNKEKSYQNTILSNFMEELQGKYEKEILNKQYCKTQTNKKFLL